MIDPAVVLLAKAPEPGRVKTRLAAALGVERAARLHERLVERTLETACASDVGPVELCCAPDARHPFFLGLAARFGVALTGQGEGDVGARMARAFARRAPAILAGCDCPAFETTHFVAAATALRAGDEVVLAPAEDGGYVLVALSRPIPELFDGIEWGGPTVLAATRAKIAAGGLATRELATLWDVDRPDDLQRLQAFLPALLEER